MMLPTGRFLAYGHHYPLPCEKAREAKRFEGLFRRSTSSSLDVFDGYFHSVLAFSGNVPAPPGPLNYGRRSQ
jgi:hypothetical protein